MMAVQKRKGKEGKEDRRKQIEERRSRSEKDGVTVHLSGRRLELRVLNRRVPPAWARLGDF